MDIKIAICDDINEMCVCIENKVEGILKNKSIGYEIDIFNSGEELCRMLDEIRYDLIFLDIEFPKMDGIEIGKYIREIKKDNITQIVYVSGRKKYAMELFQVRPIDFIVKPLEDKQLERVIDIYIDIMGGMKNFFEYRKSYSHKKVELYKIMYFIRDNRKVTVVTSEEKDAFYESLEKVYERVKQYDFLFIHKSYLINYRYIETIRYDSVTMTDGTELSISQSRRKEIRNGELNYKNGRIITKKQDKGMRGIGLRSVKATVEKHTETVDIEHNDTDFFVKIMMYL